MVKFKDLRTDDALFEKVQASYAAAAAAGFAEDSDDGREMLANAMGLAPKEELHPEVVAKDALGFSHSKFRQSFKGVPIWGSRVNITRSRDGSIRRMHGMIAQGIAAEITDVQPAYPPEEAIEHVKEILRRESDLGDSTEFSGISGELVVYINQNGQSRLCYEVRMTTDLKEGGGRLVSPTFLLDAKTKATVRHFNELPTFISGGVVSENIENIQGKNGPEIQGSPGKGTGPGGNRKTGLYRYGTDFDEFEVTVDGSNYVMETENVRTVDLEHGRVKKYPPYKFVGPENTHEECNEAHCPLNDAHYFGHVVFHMYNNWLNSSPLEGKLILGVHYLRNHENAYWLPGERMMLFGDGFRRMFPLVSLDVMAHEVSHGFTTDHSNLRYISEECGGINESFSDIAGEAAEFFMTGKNDFLVGASIIKQSNTALRYMDDPTRDGRSIGSASDFYSGLDMHFSSGVYNKAFFLLATSDGWDTRKAFMAFARANIYYWNETTDFVQGARGVADAAEDLGYPREDVAKAFENVDIFI